MDDNELLLLGLLRKQSMHGYQLLEFIDRAMLSCNSLKRPTAYFLLEKMDRLGWIHSEEEQDGKRPPRKVYTLTPDGESAYLRLLRENLAKFIPISFSGDFGMVFMDDIDQTEAISLLENRKLALSNERDRISQAPVHEGKTGWMLEHLHLHLEHELDWLEEVLNRLKHKAK